jgi:thymidylate synthase
MNHVYDQIFKVTLSSSNINKILQDEMNFWNESQRDSIAFIREKIDDLKDVMVENIDKVLNRGEKLEEINKITDQLDDDAKQFKIKSKRLKYKTLAK